MEGEYVLLNRYDQSIGEVYVNLNDWNLNNLNPIEFYRTFAKKQHAEEFGFRVFELDIPLPPGDTLTMRFKYDIIAEGFSENQPKNELVENRPCFVLLSFSSKYFHVIGYNVNNELLRDNYREEYGQAKKTDVSRISGADKSIAIFDLSRPNYVTFISSSIDQTVISDGRLIDQ